MEKPYLTQILIQSKIFSIHLKPCLEGTLNILSHNQTKDQRAQIFSNYKINTVLNIHG